MWVRGLLLSSLELLLWALLCIVVLAVLLFAECTFVSGLLCSFAFDLLLIATVPPLKFTKPPCAGARYSARRCARRSAFQGPQECPSC